MNRQALLTSPHHFTAATDGGIEEDGGGEQLQIVHIGLPKGWRREENIRQGGLSAGRVDVYYVSPDGKKFWTKPQLARYFGDSFDLSNFDFHSGRFTSNPTRSVKRPVKIGPPPVVEQYSSSSKSSMKSDASLLPPIRQTASIFKQPVTIVKTQKSRVKADFKHGIQESPRQLFWEKRLQGLRATDPSGSELAPSELPAGIVPAGPGIDPDTVLHSIATALHLAAHPITGQCGSTEGLRSNPGAFINPEQPLIHEIAVNEDDIRLQEERVSMARKKLEEALRTFYPGSISRSAAVEQETEYSAPVAPTVNGIMKPKIRSNGEYNSQSQSQNPHKKLRVGQ